MKSLRLSAAWIATPTIGDVPYVKSLVEQDGLLPLTSDQLNPSEHHIIAVFTGIRYELGEPWFDYHFMRKDGDQSWSHKPGTKQIERIEIEPGSSEQEQLSAVYSQTKDEHYFIGFYELPQPGVLATRDMRVGNLSWGC